MSSRITIIGFLSLTAFFIFFVTFTNDSIYLETVVAEAKQRLGLQNKTVFAEAKQRLGLQNKTVVAEAKQRLGLQNKTVFAEAEQRLQNKVIVNTTRESELNDEVTVVTAYFRLPPFPKGKKTYVYTPNMYMTWIRIFGKINNKVVAYFDNESIAETFREIRSSLPFNYTEIHVVNRTEMWAFSLETQIKRIISDRNYPKHLPNTVIPEYGMVMHAKYELMSRTSTLNPFQTKYIAWVDIGQFRMLGPTQNPFWLYVPRDFRETAVAYGQVSNLAELTPKQIFHRNMYWVCGCFFIARIDVMVTWTKEYTQYVERYLKQGLTNTDQQVLYAMQKDTEKPRTQIMPYHHKMGYDQWFFLGQMCKDAGDEKYGKSTDHH